MKGYNAELLNTFLLLLLSPLKKKHKTLKVQFTNIKLPSLYERIIFGCLSSCLWLTYLLTYLLTPWSRVLLEELTGSQLVKKFPTYYGTRRFITTFTSAHRLSQNIRD